MREQMTEAEARGLEILDDPRCHSMIAETAARWFALAPRFQGRDSMELMLRVFATDIAYLAHSAPPPSGATEERTP